MTDSFYKAFEDRFRGSKQEVRQRLEVYLPFLESLRPFHRKFMVLDLGCGRGEWLQLLKELKIEATGVDLDQEMVSECESLGLKVRCEDVIQALKSFRSKSLSLVTGFHIAEHLSFEELLQVVGEAHRALKPGGLLILETPNPENISVGSKNFYLDPTHQKPLPPKLLDFLADYFGFERTKILRMQEPVVIHQPETIPTLQQVYDSVSPDYAVIAQKTTRIEVQQAFDHLWEKDYGISLPELTNRFQEHLKNIDAMARHAAATAGHAELALKQVHQSRSWLITRPLRWGSHQFRILQERGIKSRIKDGLKRIFNPLLTIVVDFVISQLLKRERFMKNARFKKLHKQLHKLLQRLQSSPHDLKSTHLDQITNRTHQIYLDLVSTLKTNKNRKD